jgi:prevent-host-death family protein
MLHDIVQIRTFGRRDMTERPIRTIKLSEARSTFSALLNDVFRRRERVIIEKSGIPVAAIVPIAELERLDQIDEQRASRSAVLEGYSRLFEAYTAEELEAQVARVVAESRAELTAEPGKH